MSHRSIRTFAITGHDDLFKFSFILYFTILYTFIYILYILYMLYTIYTIHYMYTFTDKHERRREGRKFLQFSRYLWQNILKSLKVSRVT